MATVHSINEGRRKKNDDARMRRNDTDPQDLYRTVAEAQQECLESLAEHNDRLSREAKSNAWTAGIVGGCVAGTLIGAVVWFASR